MQPAKTPADGPSSRREARQARASSTQLRAITHACFRGSRAPHVQIMTSIMTIVHVGGQHLGIDPRKHPCRPQLGRRRLRTINQTIRTRPMTPAAASVRWSCVCRCLRRLQAPHVYSMDVFHHPRGTRGTILIFPRARPAKTPAERTIEPTRGAPGRGVVHPMSASTYTDAFAGLMFHVL
jgi:hypothetical protein